jgi:long-chain acyl-CoA synthetase
LLALKAGSRLILVPKFSAEAMRDIFRRFSPTVLASVPTMLRTLLADDCFKPAGLRTVLTGGDTLAPALAEHWQHRTPSAHIFDLYGLTETGACDFCLDPGNWSDGAGSIGCPTSGVSFRITTAEGASDHADAAGELQIRTPFAMLGYLDDPVLTEQSFADGYFRTGDLARQRPDGLVALVGRIKDIVNRAGNKIAPLEIDTLLTAHPDVAASLATGIADEWMGEALHVLIVPRAGAHPAEDELRAWLAARLERYKVPDGIHFCDSLPVGATGKGDRRAAAGLIKASLARQRKL